MYTNDIKQNINKNMKILQSILAVSMLFIQLTVGVTASDDHHEIEHIPGEGEHVEHHDHFDDANLNPSQRIDLLKTELYPELYTRPISQSLTDSYKLPFAAPSYSYVTQSYFGPYSHQSTRAIDFFGNNLEVAVARKGVVITANFGGKWNNWCNSYQNCYNQGGIWNGNHVLVQHNDGTYAMYLHMKANSLRPGITVGAPVRQGTILGDFGGTGYTCGNAACTIPGVHLHFQNNQSPGVTVVTPFDDCNEAINLGDCVNGVPQQGVTYTSINYPPSVQSYDGQQNSIYLYGTQKVLKADRAVDHSNLRLSDNPGSTSLWTLNPETQRIEGNSNLCLTDTGSLFLKAKICSNSLTQRWEKTFTFNIKNSNTGKCIVSQSGNVTGSHIHLKTCTQSDPGQYFRLSNETYPVLNAPINLSDYDSN